MLRGLPGRFECGERTEPNRSEARERLRRKLSEIILPLLKECSVYRNLRIAYDDGIVPIAGACCSALRGSDYQWFAVLASYKKKKVYGWSIVLASMKTHAVFTNGFRGDGCLSASLWRRCKIWTRLRVRLPTRHSVCFWIKYTFSYYLAMFVVFSGLIAVFSVLLSYSYYLANVFVVFQVDLLFLFLFLLSLQQQQQMQLFKKFDCLRNSASRLQDFSVIEKQMERSLRQVCREFESVTYMRVIKAYAVCVFGLFCCLCLFFLILLWFGLFSCVSLLFISCFCFFFVCVFFFVCFCLVTRCWEKKRHLVNDCTTNMSTRVCCCLYHSFLCFLSFSFHFFSPYFLFCFSLIPPCWDVVFFLFCWGFKFFLLIAWQTCTEVVLSQALAGVETDAAETEGYILFSL